MEKGMNKTVTLTLGAVMDMHRLIAEKTGGSPEIRDSALLESALASPFQTFGGVDLYPTVEEKAARMGYALISNHPFVDGNKRIGMFALLVFLEVNGISLSWDDGDVARIGLAVAAGEMTCDGLLACIREGRK